MNSDLKAGFTRLLRSFDDNPDDVVQITRAFGLATKAHKGQHSVNKFEHYLGHSLRVALILAEELKIHDTDLACAALLHDARLPDDDLKEFGDRVYSTLSTIDSWAREKASEEYFARMTKASKDTRYIKLAERLDDIRSMKGESFKEKVTRYKEETQKYVIPIAIATDDKLAFKLSVALYELK
ncbi:MAG TPA: HD domain-containing protein [Nitrososphaera sp.]|jgi:(p)ppGpp synthase/HD superfamily hydrolase|nr:HD domain-containing protein [Nitrososphaera sp.]